MSSKAERAGKNPALSALGETGLYEEFVAAEDGQTGQTATEQDHRRRLGDGCRSGRICGRSGDPTSRSAETKDIGGNVEVARCVQLIKPFSDDSCWLRKQKGSGILRLEQIADTGECH